VRTNALAYLHSNGNPSEFRSRVYTMTSTTSSLQHLHYLLIRSISCLTCAFCQPRNFKLIPEWNFNFV